MSCRRRRGSDAPDERLSTVDVLLLDIAIARMVTEKAANCGKRQGQEQRSWLDVGQPEGVNTDKVGPGQSLQRRSSSYERLHVKCVFLLELLSLEEIRLRESCLRSGTFCPGSPVGPVMSSLRRWADDLGDCTGMAWLCTVLEMHRHDAERLARSGQRVHGVEVPSGTSIEWADYLSDQVDED